MVNSSVRPGDTDNGTDLTLAHVAAARSWIDPTFLDTPQFEDELLNRRLGRRVVLKLETANPIRSFKARGVSFALRDVPEGAVVVCSSSGNFGQAVAYVGRARGLSVKVYTASDVNPAKRERMQTFGAEVLDSWPDMDAARAAAVAAAEENPAIHLITDGVQPAIAEGAATIAEELSRAGELDCVVVPIGDGSLISGIGLWLRAHAPRTRLVGVNPALAPAMRQSYLAGAATAARVESSFAEGISVTRPHAESVARVRALVDEIVLVDESEILAAMAMIARHLSVLPEPAGAAGLAAIACGHAAGDRVATIVTGGNLDSPRLSALLNRLDLEAKP